ncbi:MAG: hypothetical protein M1823_001427 [Watsoniomyces obsoletus]|nr:MAG: hypothetical protein M1823_001427 [Watsoniomyces obsoletus]
MQCLVRTLRSCVWSHEHRASIQQLQRSAAWCPPQTTTPWSIVRSIRSSSLAVTKSQKDKKSSRRKSIRRHGHYIPPTLRRARAAKRSSNLRDFIKRYRTLYGKRPRRFAGGRRLWQIILQSKRSRAKMHEKEEETETEQIFETIEQQDKVYEEKKKTKQQLPSEWDGYFARAYYRFNREKYDTLVEEGYTPPPVPREFIDTMLPNASTVEELRQLWQAFSLEEREERWPRIMAEVMYWHREETLRFLVATFNVAPPKPRKMLADALDLATHVILYKKLREDVNVEELEMLHRFTMKYLQRQRAGALLREHTIRLLMVYLDAPEAAKFYHTLNQRRVKIKRSTGIWIVHEMARKLEMNAARHMMRRMVQTNRLDKKERVLAGRDFLLAASVTLHHAGMAQYGRDGLDILNEFLGYGFKPDTIIYNISIMNASRMNEVLTAWKLYEALQSDGLQPDNYTFASLIVTSKKRQDWDGIEALTHDMHASGLKPNLWLVTEMLHTSYMYSHCTNRNSAFQDMTKIYETFFSPKILKELGLIPSKKSEDPNRIPPVRPDPLPATMHIMLNCYLRYCTDEKILTELWARYKTSMASNPFWNFDDDDDGKQASYIPTAFMYAFGKMPQTIIYCPTILGDMLNHASTGLPPPSVETWNVLMLAYIRNRQYHAAGRVFELMEEHGVVPDQFAWTSLISGWARGQNIAGAVGAVKRMLWAGFEVGEKTIRALMWIQDRRQLAKQMMSMEEEWESEKRKRALIKLKERKEERLKRRKKMILLMGGG